MVWTAELEATKVALNVMQQTDVLLDSGANITVNSDITHMDTSTTPSCGRAKEASGVGFRS